MTTSPPPAFCTSCGAPLSTPFCTGCGARAAAVQLPAPAADPDPGDATAVRPAVTLPEETMVSDGLPLDATAVRPAPRSARRGPASPPPALPDLPPPPRLFRDDPTATAVAAFPAVSGASLPPGPGGARRAETGRPQVLLVGATALVLVLALVVCSVVGLRWWRERPLDRALSTAGQATQDVLEALADAEDIDDLSNAAARAPEALSVVEDALADVAEVRAAHHSPTRALLGAQADLLEAAVPLGGLTEDSLTAWGTSHGALNDAVADLQEARTRLSEEGVAVSLSDPRPVWEHASEVVRTGAASALAGDLESLVAELATVRNTTGAALLGSRAAAGADTAQAAMTGVEDPGDLEQLRAALTALGGLQQMTPDALAVWEAQREPFVVATTAVGLDPQPAAEAMDAWIADAEEVMAAWRVEFAAAEASRSEVTAALDTYAETMRPLLRRYQQARDSLSDVLNDSSATSHDVEWAMGEGVTTRDELYAEATATTPPAGTETAHAAVVDVLSRAATAVREGQSAVAAWNLCWESCPEDYRETEGWQSFSSQSEEIRTEFTSARGGWNDAVDAALAAVDAVPLPALPDV